jgi:arylsulfatase A-like enzyme
MKRARRTALVVVLAGACMVAASAGGLTSHGTATAATACQLGTKAGQIKHVMYFVFDNTHFNRDRPDVQSDLEQMPNLLNFLKSNGTVLSNDHTILISHTAGGILTSMTGLYPDRNGQTVSNSYQFFNNAGVPTFASSFKYWTDTVDGADDSLPNMVSDGGQTTPEPWLTFTRAGCDVGGVSAANIELENNNAIITSTGATDPAGDMTRVFGEGSPEWLEGKASQLAASGTAARALAQTDFVGIAIHCTLGSTFCSGANAAHARPDDQTTVPGSNDGYQALFGAKYVNPAITNGQACVKATDGTNITDPFNQCGFPGFDGALAKNTLGMVAQMQEAGVPVTYAYISDAHDNHALARASGPGEADYKQQLADYNTAFGTFFDRLKADGITKDNTLFVFTADEGDHFAGGTGTLNGDSLQYAHTVCTDLTACPSNQIGEVTTNLKALLPATEPSFVVHSDDAPTVYVTGQPTRGDAKLRQLERDVAGLTAVDPYKGGATVPLAERLADTVEEKTLHMVNADPKRTPSFTLFGNDDFFFQTSDPNYPGGGAPNQCAGVHLCVTPGFAWNHGDFQSEIANNWLGIVGPGIARNGVDPTTWADHTDTRPTMLAALGLADGYTSDGRVITQVLDGKATPKELDKHGNTTAELGAVYKQLNAPFGSFGLDTLQASTKALASPSDLTYESIETKIANLTFERDTLAGTIRAALNGAAFGDEKLDESQAKDWITKANGLIDQAHALATAP